MKFEQYLIEAESEELKKELNHTKKKKIMDFLSKRKYSSYSLAEEPSIFI